MRLAEKFRTNVIKPVSSDMNHDQNWRWPEKTWFRERLNAIKAREHEQRQKATESSPKPDEATHPASTDKKKLKVD
ncbi:MAG: hypothetical protein ACREQ2_24450 [Candidatus Binatia bacterium]